MSLRGGHLLFPTKQSPVIRRLLRLRTRAPRSDIFHIRFASDIICVDDRVCRRLCFARRLKHFIQRTTVLVFGKEINMANKEQKGKNKEKKKKKKEKPAPPKK